MTARAKATIKKVAGKLKKASKTHAKQSKALSAIKLSKGGSTVNEKKNVSSHKSRIKRWQSGAVVCKKSTVISCTI